MHRQRIAAIGSHVAAHAAAPLQPPDVAARALSERDKATFAAEGVLVLRGYFSEAELAAIHGPIVAAQNAPNSPLVGSSSTVGSYNYPDMRSLVDYPELARASFDDDRVVEAVETLLQEQAEIMQFGALTHRWTEGAAGSGAHYDYKPARPGGSSVDWLFAVIPLTDYNAHDGPLLVAPGSAPRSKVLPRPPKGDTSFKQRVHHVEAAQVPEYR
jgi:ectoine hydroxylase-related dioxygenase (phytanoyl-CoA dioxygenase family)